MSKNWDYAKLSQMAKAYGGPEKLLDTIKKYNHQQGIKEGRLQLLPWIGVAFAGGCWVASQIPKAVQYFKSKERKITAEEAEKAEEILIKEMKEAETQKEEKVE